MPTRSSSSSSRSVAIGPPTRKHIVSSVYVLVAIVKKRLGLDASLYEILQILSLTMFETTPLHQLLTLDPSGAILSDLNNQLNLFET